MSDTTLCPIRYEQLLVGAWQNTAFDPAQIFAVRQMQVGWVRMSESSFEARWDGNKVPGMLDGEGGRNDFGGFLDSLNDEVPKLWAKRLALTQEDRLSIVQYARVFEIPARIIGRERNGRTAYDRLDRRPDIGSWLYAGTEEELARIAAWKTYPDDWEEGDWHPYSHRLELRTVVDETDVWSSAWTDARHQLEMERFIARAKEGVS